MCLVVCLRMYPYTSSVRKKPSELLHILDERFIDLPFNRQLLDNMVQHLT